jgi:hypothetical protein
MFVINIHTKFYMSSTAASLDIAMKQKAKYRCYVAVLLLYIL